MRIAVIINPRSGRASQSSGLGRAALATRVLSSHGIEPHVFITERAGHARELAAAAVAEKVDRVFAWGGDGTINEVASALASAGVPLGIIPAGSGNGFARDLGVPRAPERALVHALTSAPRSIDAGEIDRRFFVNLAGIGIDAFVATRFNAPGNLRRGALAYARCAASALFRYVADEYVIETPSRRWTSRALLLVIANSSQWGNNARIAPGARVDDGQLDLVVVGERPVLSMVCQLPRLFLGTVTGMKDYTIQRIERVTIQSTAPIGFHVDGEPRIGGTRIEARVLPGAVRVCA